MLLYEAGSNCLLGVDSADNVTYVKVPVEGTVRIFKAASGKRKEKWYGEKEAV